MLVWTCDLLCLSVHFQKYSDSELANIDPSEGPTLSVNAYIQRPVERIKKYKILLKVKRNNVVKYDCYI